MTTKEAKSYILNRLVPKFGDGEAKSMLRIIEEDYIFNENLLFSNDIPVQILEVIIHKLINDYPIQYLVGKAYFYNGFFKVNENVLIPRSETELLVYEALKLIKQQNLKSCMDIGTGSGCIPISIQSDKSEIIAYGVDICLEALSIAEINNKNHKTNVDFINIDFLDVSQWKVLPQVELLISNPPYIHRKESGSMSRSTLEHEPHLALFPNGEDEMIFYKYLKKYFIECNAEYLLCELNEFNAKKVKAIFTLNFANVVLIKDLEGKDRVLKVIK